MRLRKDVYEAPRCAKLESVKQSAAAGRGPSATMAGPDAASDAPEPRVRSRAEHAKTRIERVAMRFSVASRRSNVAITANRRDRPRMRRLTIGSKNEIAHIRSPAVQRKFVGALILRKSAIRSLG